MTNIKPIIPYLRSVDYKPPLGYLYEGSVTSGTINSLTDSSANWEIDEWVGKAIKIKKNGGSDFENGVILSNTTDTLTFDSNLIFEPCSLCAYQILHTYEIKKDELDIIVALNLEDSECAVVLPKSTPDIERRSAHIYIERSNGNNFTAPIICKKDDTMANVKYGELIYRTKGIRVYAHQWLSPHWDIIQTYNIKRFATGYWDADESITATTFTAFGANIVYDNLRRFIPYTRDDVAWIRYRSLIERPFMISFIADISKSGGGVEMMK